MTIRHAAVWIDQQEARIFHVAPEGFDESTIHAPHGHLHRHPKGPEGYKAHPDDAHHFFREVARALDGFSEVLVLGPSKAKLEFIKHVHEHDRALVPKIVGVETADHPTDPQIVAHVRKYFKAADRMR
jgi:stalled ribosome rescue protein Dom34